MNDLLDFLAHNKRYWLPPILIFAALVAYLAWSNAQAPAEPFDYRPN